MTPEKDIMHYARLAEQAYKDKYDEETAPAMFVVVDTADGFCLMAGDALPLSTSQLMFRCQKREGRVCTEYVHGGEGHAARALGLRDTKEMRRVEGGRAHLVGTDFCVELPEELRNFSRDFFKIKITNLDELLEECDGTGWGDEWCRNVLEVLGDVVNDEDAVDDEKGVVQHTLICYCRPANTDYDADDYANFLFSHFEVPEDFPDSEDGSCCIYVCYKYWGMVENSNEELDGTHDEDDTNG